MTIVKVSELVHALKLGTTKKELIEQYQTTDKEFLKLFRGLGIVWDGSKNKYDISSLSEETMNQSVEIKQRENRQQSDSSQKKEIPKVPKVDRKKKATELFTQVYDLPEDANPKKASIIISNETYDRFERFAKSMKGIGKNDLVELAIIEFLDRHE